MLDYKLTKLPNGLKIITAPLQNTRATTVLVLVGCGSRYEEKNINGISHFLEHMFFKGTEKRPTTLDIVRELDGVGASYNAYTGEEVTGFYVRVPSAHFQLGLDVLTDMLFNSKLAQVEIDKEKNVIVEEINMYNDDPKSKVALISEELFYGDQPLGRKITGEKDVVVKFTHEDFVKYKNSHYRPENMIVVVAGGTDNIDWETAIKEKFEKLESAKTPEYSKVVINQTEPKMSIFYKDTDQAHLILGYRSKSRLDSGRPIVKIMTNLMGQMMSSRLFLELREKRGLCYYVNADTSEYQDAGSWDVSAGVDVKRAEEAVTVILNEIEKLKTELVTEEELKRAKENLKGHLYLSLEESFVVAEFLAERELYFGQIKDPDELVKEFDKVTAEDIQSLAKEIFVPKNLNFALVGPFKDKEKFSKIINK